MSPNSFASMPSANLIKQFAAMLYDSLLIFAVLLLSFGVALLVNGGEPIESLGLRRLYLLLTVFTYYAWFWQKSGQTLGMRVWKIRIVNESGDNPGWLQCYWRLVCAVLSIACLGLGYWWRIFTSYSWHDRLSKTRIINLSAPSVEPAPET